MDEIFNLVYTIAVILFIGNLFSGLIWKKFADSTNDAQLLVHTFRGIFRGDIFITLPTFSTILILNFFVNSEKFLPIINISIYYVIALCSINAIGIFVLFIHPLRKKMYNLILQSKDFDVKMYQLLSKKWLVLGCIEVFPLVGALILSLILR